MINHLWQSTLFAFAAWLLTLALLRNRAQVRYWLWFSASLKFLVPFALLMSLGSLVKRAPAVQTIATPSVSLAMEHVAQPFPETVSFAPAVADSRDWILIAILAVWTCGIVGVALMRFRGWLRIRAVVRASSPLEMSAPVEVRSSAGLLEPGVVGLFHPILLLPAGIAERLTAPQLEAVLTHELCHVRRRDNLFASIHMIVEAMFWFHPLVWWIGTRLVEERERACDEEVLRLGGEPQVYAEAIVNVCKFYVESPLVCVSGVTGSDIKKRIEAIMANRFVLRLNFTKKATLAAAGLAALVLPIMVGIAQSPPPKFEVASIRPCLDGGGRNDTKNGPPGGSPIVSPGRLNTGCAALAGSYPMAGLIQRAYGRLGLGHPVSLGSALPISGGPAWIYSARYVINAEAADKASTEIMEGPMLQALLEDRFRLKVHRATREVPVYALTVAKGGSKLQPVAEGGCVPLDPSTFPRPPLPQSKRYCDDRVGGRKGPNTTLSADEATVDNFSKLLGLVLDRPIIDKTGLPGKYNFHLEFAVDQSTPGAPDGFGPPSDGPPAASIFTVVQEQLGLKLEPTKGPREFLVIDSVQRPSGN